ncbi:unnamed protein product [Moneuplotes crassus]|uniref:AP2/ERF domain-containing protein n=1 Tax=Euplotes crassus TaxID=5936 RepID=A0AAD1XSJ6_EUPCR|nr:unnamed protein product [Moneuplotes crassus]
MNFLAFDNNTICTPSQMGNKFDIIQELSSVYCLDQFDQNTSDDQDYCFCSCKDGLITPSSQINELDYFSRELSKNFLQKKPENIFFQEDKKVDVKGNIESDKPPLRKKRRSRNELDITHKLLSLRWRILNCYVTEFTSSSKKAKNASKKQLRRRSKYIGVSRNNSNWQALINIDQIKRYIGTFVDELQAARAYDLYSVALRGQEAFLNFDYSAEDMLERIEYFLEHKCVKFDD